MSLTPKLLQQGAAGSARPVYIEDVFSTWLYTGNGSTQTITNGIDLSGKGGLVWIKNRSTQDFGNTRNHWLFDSARTAGNSLYTNSTSTENTVFAGLIPFGSTGFSINTGDDNLNGTGANVYSYVSWTFRKQRKFFDVVTYTGNGSAPRNIAHNLGSVPGCIMIKRTDTTGTWTVYHAGIGNTKALFLNADSATDTNSAYWNNTTPTSSVFTLGGTFSDINASGGTYVAYLFADNAGGFGLTGNENVISCGSYTGSGAAGNPITLGYEPQWLLVKGIDTTSSWMLTDTMRSMSVTDNGQLYANISYSENIMSFPIVYPTATGFAFGSGASNYNLSSSNYIYIAIRRGPMKVPTTGTSVFAPTTYVPNGAASRKISTSPSFPVDLAFFNERSRTGYTGTWVNDRLRDVKKVTYIFNGQFDEEDNLYTFEAFNNDGVVLNGSGYNSSGTSGVVLWLFRRAPGFFDEVCYTGTGSTRTVTHNLGVVPELMIVKRRSGSETGGVVKYWFVYSSALGNTKCVFLNTTDNSQSTGVWNSTTPTSSVFTVENNYVNYSGDTYVAYLFASCPGVSKVGTYTGNGSTQTINCGFAAGARFVLIKRTDSTGDWYTFDTARGIVSGNDPFLKLNTITAESSSYDAVDPDNSGFIVNNDATNFPINVASATYIFLAIA